MCVCVCVCVFVCVFVCMCCVCVCVCVCVCTYVHGSRAVAVGAAVERLGGRPLCAHPVPPVAVRARCTLRVYAVDRRNAEGW